MASGINVTWEAVVQGEGVTGDPRNIIYIYDIRGSPIYRNV